MSHSSSLLDHSEDPPIKEIATIEPDRPSNKHQRSQDDRDLRRLLQLLLGDVPEKVLNPQVTAEAVSQVLPEAMTQAKSQQDTLTAASVPTVEAAITASVQTNAAVLSEALFPVIGPATRKSITAAIGNLVQSLNQTLEYSLSPQSFKWRIEARRTGKSFAEVVLLRTLVYQVEQVFLIHKETGLVLQHIVSETAAAQDPDLVSAMLTAIQDFVKDSFAIESGDSLDTLELGDLTLWLEEGPQTVLACVIRGTAPQDLRQTLKTIQESIHLIFGQALQNFEGDTEPFENSKPYLEDCFQARFVTETQEGDQSPMFTGTQKNIGSVVLGTLTVGWLTWTLLGWQTRHRWRAYVATLEQEPGLVVLDADFHRGKHRLKGLRDPLAANPTALLEQTKLNPEKVTMDWAPYLSLAPAFMSDRTQALFNPPATVNITEDEAGTLHLSGQAPVKWIQRATEISATLESVSSWNISELIPTEWTTFGNLQKRIESRQFAFEPGSAELVASHQSALDEQAADIKALLLEAKDFQQAVDITVWGYSGAVSQLDSEPTDGSVADELLSGQGSLESDRAKRIKNDLVSHGISASLITAKGLDTGADIVRIQIKRPSPIDRFRVHLAN